MATHKEISYKRAPLGEVDDSSFEVVELPVPVPGDGQVLVRTHYLSIDPYMRRQMSGGHGYAYSLKPGGRMIGRGVGVVVESRAPGYAVGDAVQSEFGWREHAVLDAKGLRKVEPDLRPLSLSLGIVGQSGATAWVGLTDVAAIQPGETVLVSAAAGAVGSAVGQIARLKGCRAIGIAGGADKCRHVTAELGFDACIDYKAGPVGEAIAKAAPGGIDVYFDNVGGEILDGVLPHLNLGARVPVCGMISQYNLAGERTAVHNIGAVLDKCVRIEGFRIGNRLPRRDHALVELMQWYREGKLKWRETVAVGIEAAPAALANVFRGGNVGKQVVRLV